MIIGYARASTADQGPNRGGPRSRQARGVKFGRKNVLTVDQRAYVAKLCADGERVRHIARVMGVGTATIGRIAPIP